MRKVRFVRLFCVFVCLMFGCLPFVLADETLLLEQTGGAGGSTVYAVAGAGFADEVVGNDEYLSVVSFNIKNLTASATGTLYAELFDSTLTVSLQNSSSTVSYSSLCDDDLWNWYNFTFGGNYSLENGVTYHVACRWLDTPGAQASFYRNGGGNYHYNNNGVTWVGSTLAINLRVYTNDTLTGGAPAPTPTPTVSPSTGLSNSALNTLLGQLFWWLAVLIIVLGPAFVFGVLFKGGTWGFLVGLLAGAGLGYWLMPSLVPLWLVVGVVFAVAAMAWSAMGRSS